MVRDLYPRPSGTLVAVNCGAAPPSRAGRPRPACSLRLKFQTRLSPEEPSSPLSLPPGMVGDLYPRPSRILMAVNCGAAPPSRAGRPRPACSLRLKFQTRSSPEEPSSPLSLPPGMVGDLYPRPSRILVAVNCGAAPPSRAGRPRPACSCLKFQTRLSPEEPSSPLSLPPGMVRDFYPRPSGTLAAVNCRGAAPPSRAGRPRPACSLRLKFQTRSSPEEPSSPLSSE